MDGVGETAGAVSVAGVVAGVVASGVAVVSGAAGAAGLAAGVVSVFCSQAASNAALAKMQMYFFIVVVGKRDIALNHQSGQEPFLALEIRPRAASKAAVRILDHVPLPLPGK